MDSKRTITNDFLIQSLKSVLSLARSFENIDNPGVLGILRESLIESFLERLLMPPFKVGTGVIVDSKGKQSGQCDVIIWDDSIFRPLYSARGAGIYLIESVVAVIEIKSTLNLNAIRQAIRMTQEFKQMEILGPRTEEHPELYWSYEPNLLPLSMIFGFESSAKNRSEKDRALKIANELDVDLPEYLQLVCVPGKTSWVFQEKGHISYPCDQELSEILAPFAGMLNTLKLISTKRGKPYLGPYMVRH